MTHFYQILLKYFIGKDDDNSLMMVFRMWVFTPAGLEMNLADELKEPRGSFTSVWNKVG